MKSFLNISLAALILVPVITQASMIFPVPDDPVSTVSGISTPLDRKLVVAAKADIAIYRRSNVITPTLQSAIDEIVVVNFQNGTVLNVEQAIDLLETSDLN